MADEPHFIDGIGSLLALLGLDPARIQLNFELNNSSVMLAVPDSKVALVTDGDEYEDLLADDWHITRMDSNALKAVSRGYSVLAGFTIEHLTRASSEEMIKSGSQEEERLLQGILRANIKMPTRDYTFRRDDGTEMTVPDFAWPELKLAFFVDGLWWHVSKDDSEALKKIAKSKKNAADLLRANKSRAERDAANRSDMTLLGWHWLSCTDRDLSTDAGVKNQVDKIMKMMRMLQKQKNNTTSEPVQDAAESNEETLIDPEQEAFFNAGSELFPTDQSVDPPAGLSLFKDPLSDPVRDPEDVEDVPEQDVTETEDQFAHNPKTPQTVPADDDIDPLSFF